MKITVTGKNIGVTDALRAYVEKRVGRLDRYLKGFTKENIECTAILSVEGNMHVTEVTIELGAITMRAEERTIDMYGSIDGVVEKLERQIRKYKTRVKSKNRQDTRAAIAEINRKLLEVPNGDDGTSQDIKIVRRKKFVIKPMSVEEAVMQMDLLGHDFFVFLDAEDHQVKVVYKRKDGNYGLIEPDIG
ncbi:MAG: ribosome-associated translation inhibitor RaiA [Firmicutes bacterium]|nr:ribosome-associated translation inhibitor RaiA [Bacillota bacterium]MDD4263121.1 ribosome-associated translation inhibitor RaiA [Bacillota bacterium]MDD4693243.1 ribosome-associated translation inhibitor RaiA [Bacillota bacterium]